MIHSTLKRRSPLKRTGQLKRTKLSPVSAKRRTQAALYAKKRKAFLEAHPYCQVWLAQHAGIIVHFAKALYSGKAVSPISATTINSCDIHHKAGRTGKNYLDESTWMAVSRDGHRWIHDHPKEARARGWLA